MKIVLVLLAVFAANSVQAREASLTVFKEPDDNGFRILVPQPSKVDSLVAPTGVESGGLENRLVEKFQELQLETTVAEQDNHGFSRPIDVPHWMRGSPFRTYRVKTTPTFDLANCDVPHYRPYPGISRAAERRRKTYFLEMVEAACEAGVPVDLFDALVTQESRYNPGAKSVAGAIGLTQLMPGTAEDLGLNNPWDIRQNLNGGARYLRQQLDEFGAWHLALSAYNAGPGAVRKYGGIPPYRETTGYVRTILGSLTTFYAVGDFRKIKLTSF